MRKTPWYHWEQASLILQIRLQPRACCDEILGLHRERLKIRITAPPVKGKANAHLTAFLAKIFRVSKKQVWVLAGTSCRDKRVCIENPVKLLSGIAPPPQHHGIKSKAEELNIILGHRVMLGKTCGGGG